MQRERMVEGRTSFRERVLPPYSISQINAEFAERGERELRKWVSELEIEVEAEREQYHTGPVVYLSNHLSQLDYFVPKFAMLAVGLPFARAVAGDNLRHWVVRNLIYDFEKYGVLWHDRASRKQGLESYVESLAECLASGESVLVFPEGGRNREARGNPREFKRGFFRVLLRAWQRAEEKSKLARDTKIACLACAYDSIPEEGFFDKIDRHGFGTMQYYLWDALAHLKWRYFKNPKARAIVRFDAPIALADLTSGHLRHAKEREVAEVLSQFTRERITEIYELLNEKLESRELNARDG
ncbi:1-acyl-sn-glycerol-3-phosphate acyltransferase [Candidatus Pacearchaeota archaeon]|nr:MAG: 1-acyl-sn-glycerol-3-phosphate acyltransferase [Candidatus Pacearchaeota archaeon]